MEFRIQKSLILVLSLVILFSSCEKKEKAVTLPPHGMSMVSTIEMKEDYSQQVCFSLLNGAKFTCETYGWDLAFDCRNGSNLILMNTGKDVRAYVSADTAFASVSSVNNILWDWDRSSGEYDSLVIRDKWQSGGNSNHKIILLDLSNLEPADKRYKKMQVVSANAAEYLIRLANINGTEEEFVSVIRQPDKNFVYFSFKEHPHQKVCEADKAAWHLMFTRYKTWVTALGTTIPYNVTGVFLNPEGVSCSKLENVPFEQITYEQVKNLSFSTQRDKIGYQWKGFDFDFTNGNYKIFSNWTYIIKDVSGAFYKMRFLDFYDTNHHKGYPKLEYQKL